MPYGEYAQCPCCRKTAYDKDEIEKEFGYRNMGDGTVTPVYTSVLFFDKSSRLLGHFQAGAVSTPTGGIGGGKGSWE